MDIRFVTAKDKKGPKGDIFLQKMDVCFRVIQLSYHTVGFNAQKRKNRQAEILLTA